VTAIRHTCEECKDVVSGDDLRSFGDAYIAHIRSAHPEMPFPDVAIRNYAEATQRATGPTERLDAIGEVEIHPVTAERVADFLAFFDSDAFPDNFAWAACYCTEPHVLDPKAPSDAEGRSWQQNRSHMEGLLRGGASSGYLAYVDGRPAGWVNASKRSEYALYREGPGAEVDDGDVVGIACYVIAPPYRGHGMARRLLDRVVADAAGRGVSWIEAYPFNDPKAGWGPDYRGSRAMYADAGFEPVDVRERYTVVRRRA
jgi:GNAT superfamily N-acetyltransferase